ncbi:MAG: ATP-binding protein [Halopseudomonas aestusnigri]
MFKELRQSIAVQLVLVLSITISILVIGLANNYRDNQQRLAAHSYASSYGSVIRNNVVQALSATYPLAAQIQMKKGDVSGFRELATEMLPFYPGASSFQLAPAGVVSYIVPLEGNEKALGHQLLKDPERDKEAFLAKETDLLTLAGPFELKQGGVAAAGRLPIFIQDTSETDRSFWGFSTVLIRFPEVLEAADLSSLVDAGIAYELSRIHPDTGKKQIIISAGGDLSIEPETYNIDIPNGVWTFSVSPIAGWSNSLMVWFGIILGIVFCFLATFSASLITRLRKTNQNLEFEVSRRTEAFQYSAKAAQEANMAKSKFLSSMSHELRTPMNAVLGFTDMLVNDNENPLSEDHLESMVYVRESGEHLLCLINEVLDLSKIEAGHAELSFQPVNCTELLEQVIQLTIPQAEKASIDLLPRFRDEFPLIIWADQTKIKQVMLNFVSNAIKYNKVNGKIDLWFEKVENNKVRINVRDTGDGVPEEQLELVFEPFNRLDKHKSKTQGTGIGLTICQKLVGVMDGEIGVYRNPDQGLTFWVEFNEWEDEKVQVAQ